MPNWNDAFPSQYLKAADLKGAQVVVTIERVAFEPVGREKEMKAVIYFVGKTRGLVCNKTNGKRCAELAGSAMTEDWSGVAIALYPTECEFAGETVDCIRIKAVERKAAPRPPVRVAPVLAATGTDGPDDDLPAFDTHPPRRPTPRAPVVSELTDDDIPF